MEFEVIVFFRDHGGNYFLPPNERVTNRSTEVQEDKVDCHDLSRLG